MSTDFAPHNMVSNISPAPYIATASSFFPLYGDWGPWKAFDGLFGNNQYWVANANTGWIAIDLGYGVFVHLDNYDIKVNTIPEPNRAPKDWTMQGSIDNVNWDTLDTVSGETAWGSGESRNYVCDTTATKYYRYFRVNVTLNNGDTYLEIAEIYLYGTNSGNIGNSLYFRGRNRLDLSAYSPTKYTPIEFGPHNMSNNTTPSPYVTSDSSHYNGDLAYMAFDGLPSANHFWITNGVSTGWIKIDIGSGYLWQLHQYAIQVNTIPEPNRAPKDWTIQGSLDDSNWDTLGTITGQTSWASGEIRNFMCDVIAGYYRYFKLDITLNNGDAYLQVAEMYLYGVNANPPTSYLRYRGKNRLDIASFSLGQGIF